MNHANCLRATCVGSYEKVHEGNDLEKAQSERNSHSKNRGGKNQIDNKVLYLENIS